MVEGDGCKAQTLDGVRVLSCTKHGLQLVERSDLESKGLTVDSPTLNGLFCPISWKQFSRENAAEYLDDLEGV